MKMQTIVFSVEGSLLSS